MESFVGCGERIHRTNFCKKVEFLRTKVAGCGITTDVIAGFPGETDEDHENSVSVMRAAEFSDAHVFPYSARPGTSANHFDEQLEPGIKAERAAVLREISAASALRFRDAMIGEVTARVVGGSSLKGRIDRQLRQGQIGFR